MRKYKLTALLLCAAMAISAASGCSDDTGSRSMSVTSQSTTVNQNNEGRADHEVSAAVSEKASANKTGFTLNRVIDAGNRNEKNERFIYLDVTIDNTTDKEYELNILNNFYLLLSDGSEIHYHVGSQLYATNNLDGYIPSPFTVPASGQFSGIIGGFAVGEDVKDFTVCFFPTLNEPDKTPDVIKVDIAESDITVLTHST
ncbi:MAG: DUF4352 domain-containing protein [Ruminococcus sp.]|nr:DUF4352 domain-containing protein [Ruminococcus sp.]